MFTGKFLLYHASRYSISVNLDLDLCADLDLDIDQALSAGPRVSPQNRTRGGSARNAFCEKLMVEVQVHVWYSEIRTVG